MKPIIQYTLYFAQHIYAMEGKNNVFLNGEIF